MTKKSKAKKEPKYEVVVTVTTRALRPASKADQVRGIKGVITITNVKHVATAASDDLPAAKRAIKSLLLEGLSMEDGTLTDPKAKAPVEIRTAKRIF